MHNGTACTKQELEHSGPVVYVVRNWLNGKKYIGSTVNGYTRFCDHQANLRRGKHHSIILQRAWNKYGEDAFVFEIVEHTTLETLLQREQHYLDQQPEYNASLIAGPKTRLGMKSSPEHRANQSKALKGRISPNKGKHFTEEHKKNLSRAVSLGKKGIKLPAKHREHIRKSLEGKRKSIKHRVNQSNWWKIASKDQREKRLAGFRK